MRDYLLIFFGGGIGSITRYFLGKTIASFHACQFPYGTLVVNIVACFVLGFVVGLADHKQLMSAQTRIFWTVGFCGGFSTFSTFSLESIVLIQKGLTASAILYMVASVAVCLGATLGGLYFGSKA